MHDRIEVTGQATLDLGCGDRMRTVPGCEAHGVDIGATGPNIHRCKVGLDPLPFEDETFFHVYAFDFLEHLHAGRPRIFTMDEVWRVLKPGGVFESRTPFYDPENPRVEWAQDPTHQGPPWTRETFNYYSDKGGEWDRLRGMYGIKARFGILEMVTEGGHLHVFLTKREVR